MRRSLSLLSKIGLAALGVAAATAHAAPLTMGSLSTADSAFGIETVTRDSVSNLEWLDLNLTSGYSYSSITALMGAGSTFAGFRVATGLEVYTMLLHSGGLSAVGAAAEQAFRDFTTLLSPTAIDDVGGLGCTLAITGIAEPGSSGRHTVEGVGIERQAATGGGCGAVMPGSQRISQAPVFHGFYIGDSTTVDAHNSSSNLTLGGIFLVRGANAVPEPGGLPLLLMAAAAAAVLRRRRV